MANKVQTKYELDVYTIMELMRIRNTNIKELCRDGSLNPKTVYRAIKNKYATLNVCKWLSHKLNVSLNYIVSESVPKLVFSDKTYTPKQYLEAFIGVKWLGNIPNSNKLRDILDGFGHEDLWDKPLDEIDEVVEQKRQVVLVRFGNGEVRWFEIGVDIKEN